MAAKTLAASRTIFVVMIASYLISAALLWLARSRGNAVPGWKIAGWIVTAVVAAALLPALSPARLWATFAMVVALGPWMVLAFVDDARGKHWIIAAVDLSGLLAIAYAAWLLRGGVPT